MGFNEKFGMGTYGEFSPDAARILINWNQSRETMGQITEWHGEWLELGRRKPILAFG